MIALQKFDKEYYPILLSWIDTAETLMQFGGPAFTFPLTSDQLDKSLNDEKRFAFGVISLETGKMIGYAEIYLKEDSGQLTRIIIGDENSKGKGLCRPLMNLLLDYAFKELNQKKAQLNVFDWNIPAIKCYEKVGFRINPGKELYREVNGKNWTAVNMIMDLKAER